MTKTAYTLRARSIRSRSLLSGHGNLYDLESLCPLYCLRIKCKLNRKIPKSYLIFSITLRVYLLFYPNLTLPSSITHAFNIHVTPARVFAFPRRGKFRFHFVLNLFQFDQSSTTDGRCCPFIDSITVKPLRLRLHALITSSLSRRWTIFFSTHKLLLRRHAIKLLLDNPESCE